MPCLLQSWLHLHHCSRAKSAKQKNTPQLVANLSPSWRFCSSAGSLCGRTPSPSSHASSSPVVTAVADWRGFCCIPRKYRENLTKFSSSVSADFSPTSFYLSCIFFPLPLGVKLWRMTPSAFQTLNIKTIVWLKSKAMPHSLQLRTACVSYESDVSMTFLVEVLLTKWIIDAGFLSFLQSEVSNKWIPLRRW